MQSVLPVNVRSAKRQRYSHLKGITTTTWTYLLLVVALWSNLAVCMTKDQIAQLKSETRDIFYHGYDNYLEHAFPEDELRPLTCAPLTRDRDNPGHIELNDALGNYSLTLIDSLSTLAILASTPVEIDFEGEAHIAAVKSLYDFQDGIAMLVEAYGDGSLGPSGAGTRARGFDLDSKVQVFETVIRGVGGLLSAHLFAVGDLPIRGYDPDFGVVDGVSGTRWKNGLIYDGQLLRLAQDLANRLLPAFHSSTGLPYPRVNLRTGVPFYLNSPLNSDPENGRCPMTPPRDAERTETCSAGAGSLVLEFSTLSRLTSDPKYEHAAKRAFYAVWTRRAATNLVGSGIDVEGGQWVGSYTGIGAGIDSFFEYAFKSYILLSGLPLPYEGAESRLHDPAGFLDVWQTSQAAVKRHVYRSSTFGHPHYVQVDLFSGALRAFWLDSLSAFYPGLLASAGELEEAISTHLLYTALWTRYSAMPERWSTLTGSIESGLRWWGGRPEFIESTWYIYRATQDPWYLHVGEMVLRDIKRRCWTKCGWAGLQDVRTGEKMDRMESFFLGETAKYMYLLFDPDHPLNHLDANFVFTTEGHPLIIPERFWGNGPMFNNTPPIQARSEDGTVAIMDAPTCPLPPSAPPLINSATAARGDLWHAAAMAKLHLMPTPETIDSPLIEFSSDHPSISITDTQSPTDYIHYPWTLPQYLIPQNATCAKMADRSTFDLSFPQATEITSTNPPIQRVTDGLWLNSMSGIRLGMIREPASTSIGLDPINAPPFSVKDNIYRIYGVSNIGLGRDEKVFLPKSLVSDFNRNDPYFTRIRDTRMLDLVLDVGTTPSGPDQNELLKDLVDRQIPEFNDVMSSLFSVGPEATSMMKALRRRVSSYSKDFGSFITSSTTGTGSEGKSSTPREDDMVTRMRIAAAPPTGLGAAPLPDVDETQAEGIYSPTSENYDPLPWSTISIQNLNLCTTLLPSETITTHQVVAIRRGGCSFSQKLKHLASAMPNPKGLQLLIVVSGFDESGEEELVSPLLDEVQLTPSGLVRQSPIPMLMVGGGKETMELLGRARGVGLRRKWWFESQGVKISNLVVV